MNPSAALTLLVCRQHEGGWRDVSALSSVEQGNRDKHACTCKSHGFDFIPFVQGLGFRVYGLTINPKPPLAPLARRLRHSSLVFADVSARMFRSKSGRLTIRHSDDFPSLIIGRIELVIP